MFPLAFNVTILKKRCPRCTRPGIAVCLFEKDTRPEHESRRSEEMTMSTSYPPTSPPSRLARGRRAHRQSLRTLESRRRVVAVVSTARRVDGASSPVSSRSRSRARVLIATFSLVDLARASSVHYGLNARDTVIARARRVLSTRRRSVRARLVASSPR